MGSIIIYDAAIGGIRRLYPLGCHGNRQLVRIPVIGQEGCALLLTIDRQISEVGLHQRVFALALLVAVGLAREKEKR